MAAARAATHHSLVSASILDSDLASLSRECRRALKGGADRIHLDVMDGHFVPNITFGPGIIKKLRKIGKQPFDAHLMISEPSRYMDQFIDAGCDSITFHVEVEEPIEPTLLKIRKAGRLAGLALKPATPLSALDPYRDLVDIIMVMTVEPGFGGQHFMPEPAAKISDVKRLMAGHRDVLVHADGGVSADTAAVVGGYGVDVCIVGSALFQRGQDAANEVQAVKRNAGAAPWPG